MVETRGARRQSVGLPRVTAKGLGSTTGPGRKSKTTSTKDGDWSQGGSRGDSLWAHLGPMLFILGIIGTTPFVAVIVWHMFVNLDGSLTGIVEAFNQKGLRLIP